MNKRDRKRQRKIKNIKNTIYIIGTLIILSILVLAGIYLIFGTEVLNPKINKVTASYISLNNRNKTDMLKINNLKKMTHQKGKSTKNSNYLDLEITGEKNMDYDIIIYPINNSIDLCYINFSLETNNDIIIGNLDKLENNNDGGKIIFNDRISNINKYKLRMWISDKYNKEVNENSFEIEIKSR